MALKEYQTTLVAGKLYELKKLGGVGGTELLKPTIWIKDGAIDLRESNSATQPATVANMTLSSANTNITGLKELNYVTRYITLVVNVTSPTEIVVTGMEVNDLGAIA